MTKYAYHMTYDNGTLDTNSEDLIIRFYKRLGKRQQFSINIYYEGKKISIDEIQAIIEQFKQLAA